MSALHDFLAARRAEGGFTTDDAIRVFLPLARRVLALHRDGKVAPLIGVDAVIVGADGLDLDPAAAVEPTRNDAELERLERPWRAAVDVVGTVATFDDLDSGRHERRSADLTDSLDASLDRPRYLPGFVAWNQRIGHHDQLGDLFVLGLILASIACGIDPDDPRELAEWVELRRNPFVRWPALHPVLAQTICRLTELDRARRERDLAAVIAGLENYREQSVDLEFDLASLPGFRSSDLRGRRQTILDRLRERLFDLTRRNRLLHDEPGSLQSLDLTQASVPLSFRPQEIAADRIWTWNDELRKQIVGGKRISLAKHLDFNEAIYLPSHLERIAAEARRDLAEYGFQQLRLVLCWIVWTDLKSPTKERFRSPLVLAPVRLHKRKGVRDAFELEPLSSEAEINPVIRHRFSQLFGIRLPEAIDLAETDPAALHEFLAAAIRQSEPAVTLSRIDRPRIELIHARARRRLDQYRRRVAGTRRPDRRFSDVPYSYDPNLWRPAGLALYKAFVRPSLGRLEGLVGDRQRLKRDDFVPPTDGSTLESERTFYSLGASDDGNPYVWHFDLCALTLANFRYRKMSLVRDYDALIDSPIEHPVFDAAFSTEPPPAIERLPQPPSLDDRFDILPCDPTQATAIARARDGGSYIVQGPPGTGKSQTIANLIADFVGRGKRVLFVCEKRAAIDVVHARLRQCGIGHLACLIHDSQGDKRGLIDDLRRTFERLIERGSESASESDAAARLQQQLEPLIGWDRTMLAAEPEAGVACRERIGSRIELTRRLRLAGLDAPQLDPRQQETLPELARWRADRAELRELFDWIGRSSPGRSLAEHPLRWLAPSIADHPQPTALIADGVSKLAELLDTLRGTLRTAGWSPERFDDLANERSRWIEANSCAPLASPRAIGLLDPESIVSRTWDERRRALRPLERTAAERREANGHWTDRLSTDDTEFALAAARRLEPAWWRWLVPAWWKLRSTVTARYRFDAHSIRPTLVQVLERLSAEQQAVAELDQAKRELTDAVDWRGSIDQAETAIEAGRRTMREATGAVVAWLRTTIGAGDSAERFAALASAIDLTGRIAERTADWLDEPQRLSLDELESLVPQLRSEAGRLEEFLEPLRRIGRLSVPVRHALRRLPYGPDPLEGAILDRSIARSLRSDPSAARFDATARDAIQRNLETSYREWLTANAARLERQVAGAFRGRVAAAEELGRTKKDEDPALRQWQVGLKKLQHEFRKSIRHPAIRDLVGNTTGGVVKDLKPIWLMSPLSVSDALPLDPELFDVVIFDEASQITLEEAVPTLFRARQSIVVGDEKQMPPTRFFASRSAESSSSGDEADEEGEVDEESDAAAGLEEASFLAHAARVLPSTPLGWHYRSRSESLISFSNWSFYEGRLLTAPEEAPPRCDLPEIRVTDPSEAAAQVDGLLARAISYHRVEGTYERRRNRSEAEYIAQLVRELLRRGGERTLGVVAFSEAQQGEIEAALEKLAEEDAEFRERLEAEREREEDGQFCGLLVKNLENIQGDERDLMILSVCYGRAPDGKMRMNFGPINQSGGEKRLNVAFTRAKHHMAIVASIDAEAITNTFNPGAASFRNYLAYAAAISRGDLGGAERILRGTQVQERTAVGVDPWNRGVADELAEWLESEGFVVDRQVGQSRFVVDLAVRRPDERAYCLGILLDGRAYHERRDLLEREMMRPKLLADFGWKPCIVLAKDCWNDPEQVRQRLREKLAESSAQN
ncbi:MAG TPA: AAA domain-containing protein [Pirellulaceae bacterium]|nr:AAA domain-containing protein [Pirellulaceae bacterium]